MRRVGVVVLLLRAIRDVGALVTAQEILEAAVLRKVIRTLEVVDSWQDFNAALQGLRARVAALEEAGHAANA